MYPIQPLQNLNNFMVLGSSNRFANQKAILSDSPPCYPRSLCWGNGWKGLVTAQEGKEIEVIVSGIGSAREVGGRCGDDAGVLSIGWQSLAEIYWRCSNGSKKIGVGECSFP